MTEKDGSTLRPEARDDVMFDLRGVAEMLEVNGGTMNATLAQRVRASIAVLDQVAFVPICDLYELARIPALLDAADSDFEACAMDIVDEETGENHRSNGFVNLGEALTLLTSHLPLQGMLDNEEAEADSLVVLAGNEKAEADQRKAARKAADQIAFENAAFRVREVVRVTLPEGWLEEAEARGAKLIPHFHSSRSWQDIVYALDHPSELNFQIKADLNGHDCSPKGDIVRVYIERSRDGGFAVNFIPRVLRLEHKDPDDRLPYGWREDVEGHPRGKDADRPALARMLFDTLGLRGE